MKVLTYYFQLHPDLDYVLTGYLTVAMRKYNDTNTFFEEELLQFGNKSRESVKTLLFGARDQAAEVDFFSSVKEQFAPEKRTAFILGSIVGVPNVGIQHSRIRRNYTQVIDRYRDIVLNASHAKSTASDLLTNYREFKDWDYLRSEMERQTQDWEKRSQNGWSSGRREVYLSIPPPTILWQGEDAAYNFMVYQFPFNAGCLSTFNTGGYMFWSSLYLSTPAKS